MATGDDGKLLITVPDGVVEVSLDTGTTVWKLPLSGCRGTPAIEPDGGLLVTSGYAVVRWDNGTLDLVGGGFTGQSSLLAGPDNSTWVFDYSGLCALTRGCGVGARRLAAHRRRRPHAGARLPKPHTLDRARLKGEGGLLHGIRYRSYPSGHPGTPPRRTRPARP